MTAKIGLALGAGAARGLAHIPMLEVFDELGIRPSIIAGTSMGALIGAGYASGLEIAQVRHHAESVLRNRLEATKRIFLKSNRGAFDLVNFRWFNAVMIDGGRLADLVLPEGVAENIEDTQIPFHVIASDFFDASELVISAGPLKAAIAASIAIPGLIEAPKIAGRTLIDGAMTNPVPFDRVSQGVDITVAIDVTGQPVAKINSRPPSNSELAIGAMQIMQQKIARLKRNAKPPDIYIEPKLGGLRSHDFFKIDEFIKAGTRHKDELKQQLETTISAFERKNP